MKRVMKAEVFAEKANITDEEWRALRRKGIGGSDAGTICGLNRFSSLLALYADKKGLIPDKEDNEAMRLGRDLEEYVALRFKQEMADRGTPKKVKNCNFILRHPEHQFMLANVDRLIVGENAGLECKTTNVFNQTDFDGGNVPESYYCQCQHYMAVTGADRWYLAILQFGKPLFIFTIERNEEDIQNLIALEKRFWEENVLAGVAPAADGSESAGDVLSTMYPGDEEAADVDMTPLEKEVTAIEDLNGQIKALEAQKDALAQKVKEYMGNASCGFTNGFKVFWKPQEQTRLDTKRLKLDHPEIAAAYSQTSQFRKFYIKENK